MMRHLIGKISNGLLSFVICMTFVLLTNPASAQNRSVSGKVTYSDNSPVIGASVFVKGNSSIGTVADESGYYSINVL